MLLDAHQEWMLAKLGAQQAKTLPSPRRERMIPRAKLMPIWQAGSGRTLANGQDAMPARDADREGVLAGDGRGALDAKRPAAGRIRRLPLPICHGGKHQNLGGRPPGGPRGRRLPSLPLLKCLEEPAD